MPVRASGRPGHKSRSRVWWWDWIELWKLTDPVKILRPPRLAQQLAIGTPKPASKEMVHEFLSFPPFVSELRDVVWSVVINIDISTVWYLHLVYGVVSQPTTISTKFVLSDNLSEYYRSYASMTASRPGPLPSSNQGLDHTNRVRL